jgi:thiol-disulfide isomerase/thioredoxin
LRKRRPRGRRPGLAVGVELPDIPVLTDGAAGRLHDLLEPGHPAVLVYVSPGCAPCKALLPEVGRWQRTLSERLTVVTISAGEEAANQALAAQHDVELSGIERADARDVLLVRATPSALLIDGARRIGAPPATGTVAIEGLIRVGLQRATTDESVAAPVLQISRG